MREGEREKGGELSPSPANSGLPGTNLYIPSPKVMSMELAKPDLAVREGEREKGRVKPLACEQWPARYKSVHPFSKSDVNKLAKPDLAVREGEREKGGELSPSPANSGLPGTNLYIPSPKVMSMD